MKDFQDKVAIVLGATSGIGVSVAEKFAEAGAKVVVVGRNAGRGEATAKRICDNGGTARFISCDITSEADIASLMAETVNIFNKIDILVGNAGIPEKKVPLHKMTSEEFKDFMAVINTDLLGIIQSNRYAIVEMLKNPGPEKGAIVNVASILGVVGDYETASYPASKAGIINFTKAQAVSYIKEGIRMNTVSPGYVNTPLLEQLPADLLQKVIDKHPIGRFAEVGEVADAILFLCSPAASCIVGHNLLVDGGYTAV